MACLLRHACQALAHAAREVPARGLDVHVQPIHSPTSPLPPRPVHPPLLVLSAMLNTKDVQVHVTDLTSSTTQLQSYQNSHVAHTGQMFFNDTLSSTVYALSPYLSDTSTRTLNGDDQWYKKGGEAIQVPCAWPLVAGDISQGLFAHIKWEMDSTATAAVVSKRRLLELQAEVAGHATFGLPERHQQLV